MPERLGGGGERVSVSFADIKIGKTKEALGKKQAEAVRERVRVASLGIYGAFEGHKHMSIVGRILEDPARPIRKVQIDERCWDLSVLGRKHDIRYTYSDAYLEANPVKRLTWSPSDSAEASGQEVSFDFTNDPAKEVTRLASLMTVEGQDLSLTDRASIVCDILEAIPEAVSVAEAARFPNRPNHPMPIEDRW
jgi:hypothetical protein